MLIQRIITAIVLLAILIPSLFFASHLWFSTLTLLIISAGVWEWCKLNQSTQQAALTLAVGFFIFLISVVFLRDHSESVVALVLKILWWGVVASWLVLSPYLLVKGVVIWGAISATTRRWGGIFLIAMSWLALCQIHQVGVNFLLSTLCLVWVADIFAYAFGRMFGGVIFSTKKLAVTISPGKTWEGVIGGLIGVFLLALIWRWMDTYFSPHVGTSLYSFLYQRWGVVSWLLLFVLFTLAVVGDLIESLVKRSAGVKNSSHLLPGHGGVLDRIDALLPVLPLVILLLTSGEP